MSWVPPEFECGECGGTIARWPFVNMLHQEILDWRHKTIPEGTQPHRAVLGTPVPIAAVLPATEQVEEEQAAPDPTPPPLVRARPALRADLPHMAQLLDAKAQKNGWTVEAWYMKGPLMTAGWKFSRMVESVVLRLERDGHRMVASWQTKADQNEWKFDEGWNLHPWAETISSPEIGRAIATPRQVCESCGEPPALHVSTDTGLVCRNEASSLI